MLQTIYIIRSGASFHEHVTIDHASPIHRHYAHLLRHRGGVIAVNNHRVKGKDLSAYI